MVTDEGRVKGAGFWFAGKHECRKCDKTPAPGDGIDTTSEGSSEKKKEGILQVQAAVVSRFLVCSRTHKKEPRDRQQDGSRSKMPVNERVTLWRIPRAGRNTDDTASTPTAAGGIKLLSEVLVDPVFLQIALTLVFSS
jgi:hypothetical protein